MAVYLENNVMIAFHLCSVSENISLFISFL